MPANNNNTKDSDNNDDNNYNHHTYDNVNNYTDVDNEHDTKMKSNTNDDDNIFWNSFAGIKTVCKAHDTFTTYLWQAITKTMMTSSNGDIFSVTGPLWWGDSPATGEFPHKGQWREVWCFLWSTPGWVNNRDAGDLRCHRSHCDVTVMTPLQNRDVMC